VSPEKFEPAVLMPWNPYRSPAHCVPPDASRKKREAVCATDQDEEGRRSVGATPVLYAAT
jgi:hypothetical protein